MSDLSDPDFDWTRLTESTFLESVEYREETESTNTLASHIGQSEDIELPCLVIADRQTLGRGRGSNRWHSSIGSLAFSVIIDVEKWSIEPHETPLISLATGVAIADAVDGFLPDEASRCQLKWPNDVYLCERKLGGILIESVPHSSNRYIIGVGLNVNNAITAELYQTAISLRDVAANEVARNAVLEAVLVSLDDRLSRIATSSLLHDWSQRCLLTGRSVRIEHAGNETIGTCQGIDETGALLLQTETGPQRFIAGSILEFH